MTEESKCEACEGHGRIHCSPDNVGETHPCDTCDPEGFKEWKKKETMMKRSMNMLSIKVAQTIKEAPDYNTNGEGFKAVALKTAVIVRNGMENGNDTIDLQFEDEEGNKFVAMTTAKLLKGVTDACVTHHDD